MENLWESDSSSESDDDYQALLLLAWKRMTKRRRRRRSSEEEVIRESTTTCYRKCDSDPDSHFRYLRMSKERFDCLLSMVWYIPRIIQ